MTLHHFYLRPQSRAESAQSSLPVSPLLRDFPSPSTIQHASDLKQQLSTMSRSPSLSTFPNNAGLTNHAPSSLTNVHPPPAYVATFGASQVVSDAKRHFSDDEDDNTLVSSNKAGLGEMEFSSAALVLLNAFLDQLLYSILSVARSTTLVALRPAVVEVLKARLASEAIASAEEELQELLAGGEDEEEEMNDRQTKSERQRRWDTELVWKRTRLRVMVYIRLGEMEDDDEERFVREDELFAGNDRRFSQSTGLVSWAAAIFLTSVVEFVAEQVLKVSSQAAASRARRRSRVLRVSLADAPGAVSLTEGATVVEEGDMEKVALNSTLGRLWRTWRKSIRNSANAAHASPAPNNPYPHDRDLGHGDSPIPSQSRNRDVLTGAGVLGARRDSSGTAPDSVSTAEDLRAISAMSTMDGQTPEIDDRTDKDEELPEAEYPEHVLAANIPIVVADEQRDVDEIEIPGLARDPDAETQSPAPMQLKRRHSFSGIAMPIQVRSPAIDDDLPTSDAPEQESGEMATPAIAIVLRQRSHSVPTPTSCTYEQQESAELAVEDGMGEDTIDDKPEQKANAAEMAGLKRKVSPERSGAVEASKGAGAGPANENDGEIASVSGGDSQYTTDEAAATASTGHQGLVGGAVAVASAAAAATVSLVSRSKGTETKKGSPEVAEAGAVQYRAPSPEIDDRDAVSPLAERLSSASLRDEPQIMESKQVSLSPAPTPQRLVRTQTPRGSNDRLSLDNGSGRTMPVRPLAMPRQISTESSKVKPVDEEEVDIGVARTSDIAVSTPRGEQTPETSSRDSFTTPAPRRPGRLAIGASGVEGPSPVYRESPSIERRASEMTPEDFLHRRALSVTTSQQSEKSKARPRLPNDQTCTSKRASVPTALVIDQGEKLQPDKTPSPWRQSFSAAVEKNTGWASPMKKASTGTLNEPEVHVQEHPVVQKIATLKRNENKYQEDENGAPLTSANIKGPADFEMFVQGGDTVKYTLTPENVRDDPTFPKPSRTLERSVSPATQESPTQVDSRIGRSQDAKQTTSSRIIIEPDADVDDNMTSRSSRDTKRRSISRPVARNTSVHRRSGLMAREPQIVTESTRDFADFIRSTGPAKDPEVLPIVTHRSSASVHSLRSSSRPASAGGTSIRSMNRSSRPGESAPPVPPVPSGKSRNNMQPRNATSAADTSAELIDFIRSGPSFLGPQDDQPHHRISRSVAPFRTTMDSDQLTDWGERLANQPELKRSSDAEPSVRSTSRSSFKSSFRTSANSKSALLTGPGNANDVYQVANGNQSQPLAPTLPRSVLPDANEPVRKRVRSKDPYAIDMFDDDDDLLAGNRPQQESLMEFLRNSGTSTPNETPGLANAASSGSRNTAPTFPPRRGSNQGLKTLGADAVSMGRRGSGPNKNTTQQRSRVAPRNGTTSIAIGPITKPRSQLEARGDSNGFNGGTMDLSDFLRSSGPNANATSARQTSKVTSAKPEKKKSSRFSFFAFFSRGGRNERQDTRQYLDM